MECIKCIKCSKNYVGSDTRLWFKKGKNLNQKEVNQESEFICGDCYEIIPKKERCYYSLFIDKFPSK